MERIATLAEQTAGTPQPNLTTIDLENFKVIAPNGEFFNFELEDYAQQMLINGWDFIDLALRQQDKIDAFIQQDRKRRSWAQL